MQPRKNIAPLIRAVRLLRRRGAALVLVLAGRRGWLDRDVLAEIAADRAAVRWLGEVPAEDLDALYRTALAFVSPSAYEGFGLAVGDALAAGLPCVISDRAALPEVCGDAALRIEQLTDDGIASALARVIAEPELRARLAAAGQCRAAELTWPRCAAATRAAYAEALGADADRQPQPMRRPAAPSEAATSDTWR
jgi:glycosyltransferase involved in cell wall biosynthesis